MQIEIDDRLLLFLPFYKKLFLRNHPELKSVLTDAIAQEALLQALEASGDAKRVVLESGRVRLEPTAHFLSFLPKA